MDETLRTDEPRAFRVAGDGVELQAYEWPAPGPAAGSLESRRAGDEGLRTPASSFTHF